MTTPTTLKPATFAPQTTFIAIAPDATGVATVIGTAAADTFIYDVTAEAGKIYGNDGDATIGDGTVIGNFDPAKDKIMLDNRLATMLTPADLTTGLVGSSFAVTPDYFGNKTTITFDSKVDGIAEAITLAGVVLDQAAVLPLFVFAYSSSTYSLTVEPSTTENGKSAFVLTTKNVAAGTEIPFDLSGTISDADVLGGLSTHSFVIEDDGTATLPIKYIEDKKTEGDETLTVTLHDKKEISATVTVKDTSVPPPPPVNHPHTGNVMISGVMQVGESLSIQNTLQDADGLGAFSYQWLQNGKVISGATQDNYVLQAADVGKTIKVKVSYTDKISTLESATSVATDFVEPKTVIAVVPIDHKPTGTIKIIGSTIVTVGNTITNNKLSIQNTLQDADGLGDFNYSWSRDGKVISDSNQETYTLTQTDVGKKISVHVSYTDALGTLEHVTSNVTAVVTTSRNTFIGSEKNDSIIGSTGADILQGNAGFDTLTGGLDADKFVYKNIKDAPLSHSKIEIITDFSHSDGDKIDLSAIDADTSKVKDQAFSKPVIGADFSGTFTKAGQLFFDTTAHILYSSVNNDGVASFAIQLNGVSSLVAGDFIL
ncbi:MAG: hypothetical protein PHD53_07765 [Methylococcales bacterium]|nr:hypothetical protein [Methylococcales bacterium]